MKPAAVMTPALNWMDIEAASAILATMRIATIPITTDSVSPTLAFIAPDADIFIHPSTIYFIDTYD